MKTRTAVLLLGLSSISSVSSGQSLSDELTTRQGVRLRGQLSGISNDEQLLEFESAGRVLRISWDDVQTARGPSFEDNDPSAQLTTAVLGRVLVQFESERSQLVEVAWGQTGSDQVAPRPVPRLYRARCRTPCMLQVPPGGLLVRTEAEALRPSSFRVQIPSTGALLRLRSVSRGLGEAAEFLLFVGAGVFLLGGSCASFAYGIDPHFAGANTDIAIATSAAVAGLGALSVLVGLPFNYATRSGLLELRSFPAAPAPVVTSSPTALLVGVRGAW